MRTWIGLWPVLAVWLLMVLPYLAYTAPMLQREMSLPWWLRALLWALSHTWPYTKCYRLGVVLDSWPWRSSFPLRPRYREEQLELPFTSDQAGDHQ